MEHVDDYVALTEYQLRTQLKPQNLPTMATKNEPVARLSQDHKTKMSITAAADSNQLIVSATPEEQEQIVGEYNRQLALLRSYFRSEMLDRQSKVKKASTTLKTALRTLELKGGKAYPGIQEDKSRASQARASFETAEKNLIYLEKKLAIEEGVLYKERLKKLSEVSKRADVLLQSGSGLSKTDNAGLKVGLKEVSVPQQVNSSLIVDDDSCEIASDSDDHEDLDDDQCLKSTDYVLENLSSACELQVCAFDDFGDLKPVAHMSLQEMMDPYKRQNKRRVEASDRDIAVKKASLALVRQMLREKDGQAKLIERGLIKPTLGDASYLLVTPVDERVRGDFIKYAADYFEKFGAVDIRADQTGYHVFFESSSKGDAQMSKCYCDTREGCSVFGISMKVKQVGCASPWRCEVLI